jgi:predicted  nucleic acid-binding Zn-ribbon protein
MTEEQAVSSTGAPQEVDRIRDIIFGSQMRDYDKRFQTVQRDLNRLQQELDRLSDQLSEQDQEQSKKLQSLRSEMRQADDDLRDELRQAVDQLTTDKTDRIVLGDMLVEMGQRLKTCGSLSDLLGQLTEGEE